MASDIELEVVCGTYEEFVLGYQLHSCNESENSYRFEHEFADHAHSASVRCMAAGGDLVASGAADEVIKVYSMQKRSEIGHLMGHEGTVTCLCFHGAHHLLSGSSDGQVLVTRVDNWQCEKRLGRHKGGVSALAVHHSGRLALSAGHDGKLLTWDLVRGRVAFRTNLRATADLIVWSPDGSAFAVGIGGRCDVYAVATASVQLSIQPARRVICAVYVFDQVLFVGDEGGGGTLVLVGDGVEQQRLQWSAHSCRVRAAECVRRSQTCSWLVTASSDGCISVWHLQLDPAGQLVQPQLLSSCETSCRVTCIAVHVPSDKRWIPGEADVADSVCSQTVVENGGADEDLRQQTVNAAEDSKKNSDDHEVSMDKDKGKVRKKLRRDRTDMLRMKKPLSLKNGKFGKLAKLNKTKLRSTGAMIDDCLKKHVVVKKIKRKMTKPAND